MDGLHIDWSHLHSVSQGDEGVLREVIDIYLEEGPKMEADLAAAMQSGELDRVRSTAHRLLGALQIIGGRPWVAALRPVEQVQDAGQLTSARQILLELTPRIRLLNEQLREAVRTGALPVPPEPPVAGQSTGP